MLSVDTDHPQGRGCRPALHLGKVKFFTAQRHSWAPGTDVQLRKEVGTGVLSGLTFLEETVINPYTGRFATKAGGGRMRTPRDGMEVGEAGHMVREGLWRK